MTQGDSGKKRKIARAEEADPVNEAPDFEIGDDFSFSDDGDDAVLDALRDESGEGSDGDDQDSVSDNEEPKDGEKPEEDGLVDDGQRPFRIVKDAYGGERYEWDEIDPVYDSDDTDAQGPENTIGDIPLSYYDSYPHIGYDINGKKVYRPATAAALDTLLDSIEVPSGWTGLTNPDTGKPMNLNDDELDLIRKIQMNQLPDGYDPYPDMVEYFTSIEEKMPLSAAPEPKRRFIPSKHEHKRIMKLVRAIREGRILPYKPPEDTEEEEETTYDLWANEQPREESVMHLTAPKLPPPGFDLSYNPPPEYLPTKEEKEAWANQDEEEREKDYVPTKYNSLRQVPAWDLFLKTRFERCLDLYLAPRVRKQKLNVDPMSLLPKLPQPEELKPFPTVCQTIYRGHEPGTAVRSLSIDPSGRLLASGGSDGTLRIWELLTGRCLQTIRLSDESVSTVRWRPGKDALIIAAAAGEEIFLVVPQLPLITPELEQASRALLDAGFGHHAQPNHTGKEPMGRWERPGGSLQDDGVLLRITVRSRVTVVDWHRRGDHFCTVSPKGQRSAVAIHTLSRHVTQVPFRRVPGLPQTAQFHPLKPILLVAMQRSIRCYDLQKLELIKVLQPGARWLSSFDVHSGGSHVIAGSYDKRLLWHDLDLSAQPYKTMRFHSMAVRGVRYHRGGLPLFADASDDGTLQVFHGKVPSDSLENPTIVPLKVLKGHKTTKNLGVLDLDWHPREPWLVSAGADGTCRLWM